MKFSNTVLFLPAWYPNRTHASIGSFIRSHAEALSKQIQVHVLHVCGDEQARRLFELEQSLVNGVETYVLYYRKPASKTKLALLRKAILHGVALFYAYYLYRKNQPRPGVFHVHVLSRSALVPFTLNLFTKTPYYISEHWSRYVPEDGSYKGYLRKAFTKAVVKRSRGLSAVTAYLGTHLQNHALSHPNFKVISNVVRELFVKAPFLNLPDAETGYFVHVSNFARDVKNVLMILEMAKIMQQQNIPFKLVMVGDGDELEAAQAFATREALGNVVFTGFLYDDALLSIMQNAKALVMFSHYETQSVVALESLTLGVPVISSAVGGLAEIVNEQNGILVEPKNTSALVAAIKMFLDTGNRFDRLAIRQAALKKYSPEVIAQEFLDFYKAGTEL